MTDKALLVYKVLLVAVMILLGVLFAIDADAEPARFMTVTARGGLYVRRGPSTEAQAVYMLDETDIVAILDWQDGWALVGDNYPPFNPIGWACGDYLR